MKICLKVTICYLLKYYMKIKKYNTLVTVYNRVEVELNDALLFYRNKGIQLSVALHGNQTNYHHIYSNSLYLSTKTSQLFSSYKNQTLYLTLNIILYSMYNVSRNAKLIFITQLKGLGSSCLYSMAPLELMLKSFAILSGLHKLITKYINPSRCIMETLYCTILDYEASFSGMSVLFI